MITLQPHKTTITPKLTQVGVSLIELMVALVIGLVVSLAVFTVLNTNEARKRTTTSTNDIDQSAAYASYQLDKALRSAGSGFVSGVNMNDSSGAASFPNTPAADYTLGCLLKAAKGGATVIPVATAYPAPFDNVISTISAIRVAPIIIIDGGSSVRGDVIIAMQGSGGLSESINNLVAAPATSQLIMTNTAGFTASDKMLLVSTNNAKSIAGGNCMIQQVTTPFNAAAITNGAVDLAGDYYQASIGGVNITGFSAASVALNLGKLPAFSMFGVGANNTLFKYDLLLPKVTTGDDRNPMEYVDGVYQLEAIYGVAATSGALTWTPPTGIFSAATLLNGSAASNTNLKNIKAVRIALVMRTSLAEKDVVSSGQTKLFDNVGSALTLDTSADNHYRFRVIESTIPVRNALAIAR
jgi:type IV pilus assembly protein PilW